MPLDITVRDSGFRLLRPPVLSCRPFAGWMALQGCLGHQVDLFCPSFWILHAGTVTADSSDVLSSNRVFGLVNLTYWNYKVEGEDGVLQNQLHTDLASNSLILRMLSVASWVLCSGGGVPARLQSDLADWHVPVITSYEAPMRHLGVYKTGTCLILWFESCLELDRL
jgi:hypothetical protein